MGFYSKHILPRILDSFGREESANELRERVIPIAAGIVLEVGIGSALNLPYYSRKVAHLYGIDPSPQLLEMARRKTNALPFPVTLLNQTAEKIPLSENAVDTVVTTWVLCSISDDLGVLREMRRVLKPGGQLVFIEHGLSPDVKVQAWQNRITPIWKHLGGGCCLNKKIDELISPSGFVVTELHNNYIPGPRPMKYIYHGFARPS